MDDARTGPVSMLLVEDGELDAMNVRSACRDDPNIASLTIARSGAEALELLRSGTLARDRLLVLLDIDMPGMDGIELLRRIRADEQLRRLTVIILTSSSDQQDRLDAYGLHVAGYLLKPLKRRNFADCMESLGRYWTRVLFA